MYALLGISFVLVFLLVRYIAKRPATSWKTAADGFPPQWSLYLNNHVPFFAALSAERKSEFEKRVQEFLLNCRITGVETTVNDEDRLLIASSAIIPIFAFSDWHYWNLREVLVYANSFNDSFEVGGDKDILGMVGTGYMEGQMILSKEAIHSGFRNETDKHNTMIHEFVHLIDKMDHHTDGIPKVLLEKQYIIPWVKLMEAEIGRILKNQSDINPYGATNSQEFFAVVSEYFFERPALLAQKHPELYALLVKIFKQKQP